MRDTQFQNFAKVLFDELYDQFNNLHYQEEDGSYQGRDKEAEQTRKGIQENIAQRAYDLVKHACEDISNKQVRAGVLLHPNGMIREVLDMTELPKELS